MYSTIGIACGQFPDAFPVTSGPGIPGDEFSSLPGISQTDFNMFSSWYWNVSNHWPDSMLLHLEYGMWLSRYRKSVRKKIHRVERIKWSNEWPGWMMCNAGQSMFFFKRAAKSSSLLPNIPFSYFYYVMPILYFIPTPPHSNSSSHQRAPQDAAVGYINNCEACHAGGKKTDDQINCVMDYS